MIIHCILGKSGCRRIVAGQYLAIDPKGRAVMIGAVEKQKLVYILNRDSNVSALFIQSLAMNSYWDLRFLAHIFF